VGIGFAAATNLGIGHGTSPYVCRLDADDWLHEDFCLVMGAYIHSHYETSAVYCNYHSVDDSGIPLGTVSQGGIPLGSCAVFRRDIYNAVGGYDESLDYQEDFDFWQKVQKQPGDMHKIALPLWHYRRHDKQKTKSWNALHKARHGIKERYGDSQKALAVIPARGNSKGVPGKNLRLLDGIPLVAHAIRIAKRCEQDMLIAVSTEDRAIAEVADAEGVAVIDRPPQLSEDDISTISVARHAMDVMDASGWKADIVVSIQPTAPFTPPKALHEAIEKVKDGSSFPSSVSAISRITGKHPFRAYRHKESGIISPLFPYESEAFLQRQDRPVFFATTGGFYVRKRYLLDHWNEKDFALGTEPVGIEVPPHAAVDIDTKLDFWLAEAIAKHWRDLP